MPVKQKNRITRIVITASISVMIFGIPGYADAGEAAYSGAIYANPRLFLMPDRNAAPYRLIIHSVYSPTVEDREVSRGLMPAEALMLPPHERSQMAWAPTKTIGPHPLNEPVDLYTRTGATQPLLGLSWNRDAGNSNRRNIVFGLGVYISNYHDWNRSVEDLGLEPPEPDREQTDLFEKLMNVMQVVGFQIRYDF